jgi:hypothetical protein
MEGEGICSAVPGPLHLRPLTVPIRAENFHHTYVIDLDFALDLCCKAFLLSAWVAAALDRFRQSRIPRAQADLATALPMASNPLARSLDEAVLVDAGFSQIRRAPPPKYTVESDTDKYRKHVPSARLAAHTAYEGMARRGRNTKRRSVLGHAAVVAAAPLPCHRGLLGRARDWARVNRFAATVSDSQAQTHRRLEPHHHGCRR